MENPDDPTEGESGSTTAKAAVAIDETVHMPSTAQLMEVMKYINPFDQKFHEANEALKAGDFSQILGPSASSTSDQGAIYNDLASASLSDTTLSVLRAASASTSKSPSELRLKLPDATAITAALTGVCSLLNFDDGGGCGLDTPDIANLVTQMREESSSKAAPLTADVLKTVLEIRETLDLQKEKKLLASQTQPSQHQLDDQVVTTTSCQDNDQGGSRNVSDKTTSGVCCLDQQHDIGPCDSLLSMDLDGQRLSASPPALAAQENPGSDGIVTVDPSGGRLRSVSQQQQEFGRHSAATPSSMALGQGPHGDDFFIAVKIGDQAVQIPVKINVSACGTSSTADNANAMMPAPAVMQTLPPDRKLYSDRALTRPSPGATPKLGLTSASAASSSQAAISGQQTFYPTSAFGQAVVFEPTYDTKRRDETALASPVCIVAGAVANDEEFRKREVLERNNGSGHFRLAACRYRKRKKEEMTTLQEQLKKSETEKLELSTQVQVLRMELERVRNILDLHKDCPVTKQQKKKKQEELSFLSFEHHAPLFHTLTSSSEVRKDGARCCSTPTEREEERSRPLIIAVSTASSEGTGSPTLHASAVAKRSAATTSSLLLSSQPTVFSTAAGQLVQYVAVASSSQSTTRTEGVDTGTGQRKYILQPVIVSSAQAVVLSSTSSPLILPRLVKMNAAPPASTSSTVLNNDN